MPRQARVLTVAGSDSGAGAGAQADLKTIHALGAYATTAITAVTAQDTTRVHQVHHLPPGLVAHQITAVLQDIGTDAIKLGMLGPPATVAAVADALAPYLLPPHALSPHALHPHALPLVIDPVMVSTSGTPLLEPGAIHLLVTRLLPHATLLTPNLPEAETLLGHPIRTPQDAIAAAHALRALGPANVLLKGGHATGDTVTDILATPTGEHLLTNPRLQTRHTHGTGCTLASAIATGLAQSMPLEAAVLRARAYLQAALAAAPGLGSGHGPLNHNPPGHAAPFSWAAAPATPASAPSTADAPR